MLHSPRLQGALSRVTARVIGSRFAKPVARVVLVAAGLVLLAIIGRASAAGALGGFAAPVVPLDAAAGPPPAPPAFAPPALAPPALATPVAPPASSAAPTAGVSVATRGRASSDDPVILNTAAIDDLRRLPGIGQKRADAIVALRARLGRFRAIEDLMKVKGIGRAMLKRLRPLVRLDAPPLAPVGASPPPDSGAGSTTPR
jgi:competence protein ComEA